MNYYNLIYIIIINIYIFNITEVNTYSVPSTRLWFKLSEATKGLLE